MLIAGVFWGTWFSVTNSPENFTPAEFINIIKAITENDVIPMQVLLALGIIFMLFTVALYKNKDSRGFYLGFASLIFLTAAIMITLIVNLPIENEMAGWAMDALPPDYRNTLREWKIYDAGRTFTSLISFCCFSLSVMMHKNVTK